MNYLEWYNQNVITSDKRLRSQEDVYAMLLALGPYVRYLAEMPVVLLNSQVYTMKTKRIVYDSSVDDTLFKVFQLGKIMLYRIIDNGDGSFNIRYADCNRDETSGVLCIYDIDNERAKQVLGVENQK